MRLTLYRYSLPLRQSLTIAGSTKSRREGFLVQVRGEGHEGWGEIAPLDGYSRESVDELAKAWPRVVAVLRRMGLREGAASDEWKNMPSVACGLQFAMGMGPVSHQGIVKTASLIVSADIASIRREAARALESGRPCVKLKVGRNTVAADAAVVRELRRLLEGRAAIRLDANRAWSVEDACAFASAIGPDGIEFMEEPLQDLSMYNDLGRDWPLPLAFDESLARHDPERVLDLAHVHAVVLKPGLLGGPLPVARLTAKAQARRIKSVLGAMYESGVGMRHLVAMAASSPYNLTAAGLDTYHALAGDVASPALPSQGAGYPADACRAETWNVHLEMLEQVYDDDSLSA